MTIEEIDLLDKYTQFYRFLLGVVDQLSLTLIPFDRMYLQDTPMKSLEHIMDTILIEVSGRHQSKIQALTKRLVEEVERDRQHKNVDKEKVALISRFMRTIGCFEGEFKKLFMSYAEEHYKRELGAMLPITNLVEYTDTISKEMQEERERCESLFDENLGQMIFFIMKRILIDDIIGEILNSNFEQLILEEKTKILAFYYEIMKDNETFDTFLIFLDAFIKNRSEAFLNKKENVVENIYAFYQHITGIISSVYNDDVKVKGCADRALESVIIKSDTLFARIFSTFISEKMEKSSLSLDESHKIFSSTMSLFKFIQNKKVFILTYNQK